MIKRQQRIERIAAVARESVAAKSAADLLKAQLQGRSELRAVSGLGSSGRSRVQGQSRINLHDPYILCYFFGRLDTDW